MKLSNYDSSHFQRGRPLFIEFMWLFCQYLFLSSWLPGTKIRVFILRLFGASIGKNVVIKPRVRVKFPWKLKVGDNSWVGEGVWIDNVDNVSIGADVCISQEAYFCTGNHDWSSDSFRLIEGSIKVGDHVWIGAKAIVSPGAVIPDGVVVPLGARVSSGLNPWNILLLEERIVCKPRVMSK